MLDLILTLFYLAVFIAICAGVFRFAIKREQKQMIKRRKQNIETQIIQGRADAFLQDEVVRDMQQRGEL